MNGLNPTIATYGTLLLAIVLETIATSAMQASKQFTKPGPTTLMVVGYLASFYLLSLALRHIPVGIAYATWSGIGIVLISAVGFFLFKQKLDIPGMVGIAFIIAGVVIVNGFSRSSHH